MKLNEDNYYSKVANAVFLSVSQFKDFAGTYGKPGCEAHALAKIKGKWEDPKTLALMQGSHIDAWFEGTLDKCQAMYPEMFTKNGELRAEFKKIENIIARVQRDETFMWYMGGEKQTIMTGELFGAKWKIKMDSYRPGRCITDLKCIESITKLKWIPDIGYTDFVRYWGYDIQAAVYQEIERQNSGKRLPFYIAACTKEKVPDIEVIQIPQVVMDDAMSVVEAAMPRILDIKAGRIKPDRCGGCDYCKETKVLKKPISLFNLTATV